MVVIGIAYLVIPLLALFWCYVDLWARSWHRNRL